MEPIPANHNFAGILREHGLTLARGRTEILQINTGKLCNLTCTHCHVNAGPKRKEIMTRGTVDQILAWLADTDIPILDLTGGAPEMIPDFRHFVSAARALGRHVIDRCNLTILIEPGYTGLAEFLAEHEVEIVASMPCYSADNVNAQRGEGVFDASIEGLRLLNRLGYGENSRLPLHLVYNPIGTSLPGSQSELETDYKRELGAHFGIVFNNLYTITNMPVGRFASFLRHNGHYEEYLRLLVEAFNPGSVEGLMCRNTINVGWRGEVYDCDFNQQLGLQWGNGKPLSLWDIDPSALEGRSILTGEHCLGCTAGSGSSCGGALLE